MSSPHQPITVGSLFGPYRLDKLIGRGGMGEVYQAYDTVKDRTVAIKVLPERLAQDPVYRQRFQRESHAAARLREAHVIPIHDYGEIDGHLFIDMRLVDGDSLRALLRSAGPSSPERSVALVEQIAAALDAAHADGLLHRDIKPDNILLTHDGFAYLVDFGIAQSVTDPSLTRDGSAVGSFYYMAPERFGSRDLTPTTDVYALACVLFECLTGSRPFTGDTDAQIMRAHLFDPIPQPSRVRSTVPATFNPVVARGLAKNPAERYRTAGELATAARSALEPTGSAAITAPTGTAAEPVTQISEPAASGTPTGPVEPTGSDEPTNRTGGSPKRGGRTRRFAAVAGVLVLVAAALGFAGWAALSGERKGVAVADHTALQAPDVALLSLLDGAAYKRHNCRHEAPDANSTAVFYCDANPSAAAPAARFWRFQTVDALHDYYKTIVLGSLHGASCPGDPTGVDAPSMIDGKEVGRKTCFANRAETPNAPKPTLILTNDTVMAMAIYIWDTPADTPFRDYRAKQNGGQFRTPDHGQDPDQFTPADRDVLAHTGDGYRAVNCRHSDPPGSLANSIVDCSTKLGDPAVSFIGLPDRHTSDVLYQADLGQFPGRSCGGGGGSDDVWRKANGTVVGRYFCFTDPTSDPAVLCLLGVHDDLHLMVDICALPADSPENGPKTQAALFTWFQQEFAS
ncbi:MAG: protein kinase [Nocardia sp.]|uniref:serine/threonine-protein kinase n=1 Tax=Nocardia sp. TaxID=1821 RepID=UPI002636561F|nr:serine/threonine-protein kinase [Nocardia sp.]MCU1642895.1 protein kinase [Nocardia sp.]